MYIIKKYTGLITELNYNTYRSGSCNQSSKSVMLNSTDKIFNTTEL